MAGTKNTEVQKPLFGVEQSFLQYSDPVTQLRENGKHKNRKVRGSGSPVETINSNTNKNTDIPKARIEHNNENEDDNHWWIKY